MIDLDSSCIENIINNNNFFNPDDAIYNPSILPSGNNWAKGMYTNGAELIDTIMDKVRKNVEMCENLEGFQASFSTSGGTGSGLTSLIMSKIMEEYSCKIMIGYPILPSPNINEIVVEVYNTVLHI